MKFKTNIMCGDCIKKVTPYLDKTVGADNWSVDTKDPKKILTISSSDADADKVISAIGNAGYKAEKI